jgi:hypothetical protein
MEEDLEDKFIYARFEGRSFNQKEDDTIEESEETIVRYLKFQNEEQLTTLLKDPSLLAKYIRQRLPWYQKFGSWKFISQEVGKPKNVEEHFFIANGFGNPIFWK